MSDDRLTWRSESPAATDALGAALAELLAPGDLVLLRGELGTGKTTLVRAIARRLGVRGPVTSPTFTVAQRYAGEATEVAHMDAYRLEGPDAEEAELLRDAVAGDAIAFVEWPDAVLEALPAPRLEIELRHEGGDRRLVTFDAPDAHDRERLGRQLDHLRARHLNREPEPGARPG